MHLPRRHIDYLPLTLVLPRRARTRLRRWVPMHDMVVMRPVMMVVRMDVRVMMHVRRRRGLVSMLLLLLLLHQKLLALLLVAVARRVRLVLQVSLPLPPIALLLVLDSDDAILLLPGAVTTRPGHAAHARARRPATAAEIALARRGPRHVPRLRRHGGRHVAGTLIVHLHALHEPDAHATTEAHQSIVDDPKCVRAATGDNHAPTAGGVVDVDAATRVAGSVVGLRVHLEEAEVVFNVQLTEARKLRIGGRIRQGVDAGGLAVFRALTLVRDGASGCRRFDCLPKQGHSGHADFGRRQRHAARYGSVSTRDMCTDDGRTGRGPLQGASISFQTTALTVRLGDHIRLKLITFEL